MRQVLEVTQLESTSSFWAREASLSVVCNGKLRSRQYAFYHLFIHLLQIILSMNNVSGTVLDIMVSKSSTVPALVKLTVQERTQALNEQSHQCMYKHDMR